MTISGEDMRRMLSARSVALVGASGNPDKIMGRPLAHMMRARFTGQIFPVNPSRAEIQGLKSYPSLAAIGKPVDLVIVGTAADEVENVVREGIAAKAGGFVVFSSGFAELSEAGNRLQRRLALLSREHDVPILGPNCLGFVNPRHGLIASFTTAVADRMPVPGGFAFASQSGALAAYWLDLALNAGIGISKWVTTGNECSVDIASVLDHLVDDRETTAIGLYIEAIKDWNRFRAASLRATQLGKPIFAIKAGRSVTGAVAAQSHTGAIAGDDTRYQEMFEECRIQRVGSITEMMDRAWPFLCGMIPKGPRTAIVSVSGGAGVLLADEIEGSRLDVVSFGQRTKDAVAEILPYFSKPQNPIDLTANILQKQSMFEDVLNAMMAAPEVDMCIVFIGLMHDISDILISALESVRDGASKPIAVIWLGARPSTVARLRALNLPFYPDIPAAVAAFSHACAFSGVTP